MKMWMILMVFALLVSGVYSSQFFFYRILDCQDKH